MKELKILDTSSVKIKLSTKSLLHENIPQGFQIEMLYQLVFLFRTLYQLKESNRKLTLNTTWKIRTQGSRLVTVRVTMEVG